MSQVCSEHYETVWSESEDEIHARIKKVLQVLCYILRYILKLY